VGQQTGRNRCGEPTCTSPVARSRTSLLHFLIASPRAPGRPPPVCCATAQAQAQAQGELRARRTSRASTALKLVVRCCKRGPPQRAPSMAPPIQAGCGQARNTTPAANHAPILPIAAHRSTSRRSRPRPALLIALECMMRCGPPHQTSRRSQHASCLACTTVPSDVCGERALASLHGSH
jgi:hypothetical protein